MRKMFLAFLFCLAFSGPAFAQTTILFAGSEDIDFTFLGGSTFNTSAMTNGYRTNFVRGSILVIGNTAAADPPTYRAQTPTFTATGGNLWFHAEVWLGGTSAGTANIQALIIRSPDGVARILLRQTGTLGQLKMSTRNAAGTITDIGSAATANAVVNAATAIDLNVNYTCSGAGGATLYINGASAATFSGNPCTDSATTLNQVELGSVTNGTGSNSCQSSYNSTCWSEVIIANGNTLGTALWTLQPVASGNTQSWTPNTVGNINPVTINDANMVSTTASNAVSQWTTPTTPPSGTWNVMAVVQAARMLAGATGPLHFEWSCRSGGTDNVTGSLAPTAAFSNFPNQIWPKNCKTGSNWAIGDITTGFNLGVESLP